MQMAGNGDSYFDRVSGWWKNVPALAWLVIAAGVIGGSLGLFGVFRQTLGGLWTPGPAELVRITIKPIDPRFVSAGSLMNWGGGSQALFIESDSAPTDAAHLREWADAEARIEVWETMDGLAMTLLVDTVYDAESGSPTCVIEEWGIEATPLPAPGKGRYFSYLTGGASGLRAYGECLLQPKGGPLPISLWVEDEEGQDGDRTLSERVHYLKPGEPLFFEIDVNRPENGLPATRPASSAFRLQAYARIRIGGETSVVRSEQGVRVWVPWWNADVSWTRPGDGLADDSGESLWNPLEDLRPRAFTSTAN